MCECENACASAAGCVQYVRVCAGIHERRRARSDRVCVSVRVKLGVTCDRVFERFVAVCVGRGADV